MDLHAVAHHAIWRTVEGVGADALSRPNADGWSVLHVLEHLHLAERRAVRAIAAALAAPPADGIDPERDLSLVLVRTAKRNAPELIAPRGTFSSLDEARTALDASRHEVARAFAAAPADAVDRHGQPHPAFGVLSVRQWCELNGLHAIRHLAQIQEMIQER